MNLFRTSESGLVAVQPLDPAETAGLAGALLRGRGGALGAEELLFVTTAVGDGTATALGVDAEGNVVVVGAADGELGSDVVTDALRSASAAADRSYEALDDGYDGSLRESHADYFDREPLAPEAFNDDQRVRLVGAAFADDAIDLARFLSDREVAVDPVRVEAFGAPTSEEYLVRFGSVDHDEGDEPESAATDPADSEQWVAGAGVTDAAGAATTSDDAAVSDDGVEDDGDDAAVSDDDGDGATDASVGSVGAESADAAGSTAETSGAAAEGRAEAAVEEGSATDDPDTGDRNAEEDPNVDEAADDRRGADEPTAADEPTEADDEGESIDLPVLLEAVAEGIQERLVGTLDADPEDVVSVERGNELLVRPDHPAYAGGVLRYRLRVHHDGTVEFETNIYGGSEAEKEQMRAVIREHEAAIESELGYEVADRYDGFHGERTFTSFDQVAAAEIVDEFDRLVRFFNPRVMRA